MIFKILRIRPTSYKGGTRSTNHPTPRPSKKRTKAAAGEEPRGGGLSAGHAQEQVRRPRSSDLRRNTRKTGAANEPGI